MQVIWVLLAIVVSFLTNMGIAAIAVRLTGVPRDFPPFTFLPLLSGSTGGAIVASIAFAVVKLVARDPERIFLFVAVAALVLSFGLPLRLSFTKSPRFAGVTPSSQIVLVLMHAVVASTTVAALLTRAR